MIECVKDETNSDKRLLAIEQEFASVLKRMNQKENTAGTVMRELFDSGTAATLTAHNPRKTTDAHVSIIGHITPEDLARFLSETDVSLSGLFAFKRAILMEN